MKKKPLFLFIMRISLIQFCLITCLMMNAFAMDGKAQVLLEKKLSLNETSIRLNKLLNRIEKEGGFRFVYRSNLVDFKQMVSVSANRQPLAQLLDDVLSPLLLTYELSNNYIILKPLPDMLRQQPQKMAVVTVQGKVTDDKGAPLPGVSVLLKGTTTGAVTDTAGNYVLSIDGESGTLVFSFLGFKRQEVEINGRQRIDVALQPESGTLNEVVVVGFGTQRRSDLTGAVGSVKGADVKNQPARSVAEALQGRVAGVEVVKGNGGPGSGSTIQIRGVSSLNNPNPIYIIDGVRGSSGSNFNIQDIESIDVMKDASAASIYGASAAGGVVIITTKRGAKDGTMKVNLNSYAGVRKPILDELMGRDQYLQARAAILQDATNGADPASLPNTNWGSALYDNGLEQNYNLSVSGGNNKASYFVSAGYVNEDGTYIDSDFKRYNARINSDYKIGNRIKLGESVFVNKTRNNPTNSSGAFPYRSVPTMAVYDATNPIGGYGKAPAGFGGANYVGLELSNIIRNDIFGVEGNIYGDAEIFKGFNLRATFGYNFTNNLTSNYLQQYDFGPVNNAQASLNKSSDNTQLINTNYTATYNTSIGSHSVKLLGGFEQLSTSIDALGGSSFNLALSPTENFFVNSVDNQRVTGGYDNNLLVKSFFGRLNYDFAGKYLLTGSIRRDANFKRFGLTNQSGVFPSGSVAWRISEENFVKEGAPFITDLKIRGSYGSLGNDQIADYIFLSRFTDVAANSFGGGVRNIGFGLIGLANPDIKWEVIRQTDIGLDAAFIDGKLTFTADYYIKNTDGMIYNLPLPISSGLTQPFTANIGEVSNKGLELLAGYTDKVGEFSYGVSANATFNRNKVLSLDGNTNNPVNDGNNDIGGGFGLMTGQNISRTVVGRSFGEFYGYVADGIFQSDAEAQGYAQFAGQQSRAGDLRFADLNSDGVLDDADRTFIGNPNPEFAYGLNLNFGYKGFDVAMLFNGVLGAKIFNGVAPYNSTFYADGNTSADIFGTSYFDGAGITDRPRVGYVDGNDFLNDPNGNYSRVSSYWVENGSYLKLKNFQIGYTIPQKLLSRYKITGIRLYAMGNNLFALTGYSGRDPELAGGVTSRGIDSPTIYPQNRLYSFGLDVNF